MLDRRTIKGRTYSFKQRTAIIPFDAMELYLDQFMGLEGKIDFLQHGFGESIVADADNGVEMMCRGAQRTALCWINLCHDTIVTRRISTK